MINESEYEKEFKDREKVNVSGKNIWCSVHGHKDNKFIFSYKQRRYFHIIGKSICPHKVEIK